MDSPTLLYEVNFDDESLSNCLRKAADWIDEKDMTDQVRDLSIELDREWRLWSVNIFVYAAASMIDMAKE